MRALQKGRGVLVMTSHFGNWELMSLAYSLRYRPGNIVIRPLDIPFLDSLIANIRTRGGNQIIAKKGSIRKVLRLLAAGEMVGLLIDQNPAWYEGVFVPFFKRSPAQTRLKRSCSENECSGNSCVQREGAQWHLSDCF